MATKKTKPDLTGVVDSHFLAEWLEHLGEASAAKLARELKTTPGNISKKASGVLQVKIGELRRMAKALGQRPDALLYHPDDMSPEARVSRMPPAMISQVFKRELGG